MIPDFNGDKMIKKKNVPTEKTEDVWRQTKIKSVPT